MLAVSFAFNSLRVVIRKALGPFKKGVFDLLAVLIKIKL